MLTHKDGEARLQWDGVSPPLADQPAFNSLCLRKKSSFLFKLTLASRLPILPAVITFYIHDTYLLPLLSLFLCLFLPLSLSFSFFSFAFVLPLSLSLSLCLCFSFYLNLSLPLSLFINFLLLLCHHLFLVHLFPFPSPHISYSLSISFNLVSCPAQLTSCLAILLTAHRCFTFVSSLYNVALLVLAVLTFISY